MEDREEERRNEKVNRWLNMKQYVECYVQRGSANRKKGKTMDLGINHKRGGVSVEASGKLGRIVTREEMMRRIGARGRGEAVKRRDEEGRVGKSRGRNGQ
ncbi:MAG: hypothetical protein II951_05945 [Bacteroidales bacterium]|nr:hypothetical protein [Bacteroidales bacterium]